MTQPSARPPATRKTRPRQVVTEGEAAFRALVARSAKRIQWVATSSLKPYARNPRRHPATQIHELARMIDFYGFTDPILVGKDRVILAGEGRWLAAQLGEMPTVPAIFFPGMTPSRYRAFRVAHNRIAEQSPWDERLLPLELQAIREAFEDLPPVGYDGPDIDRLIATLAPPNEEKREVAFLAGQGDGDYRVLVRCTTKRAQREALDRLQSLGYRAELA